jgi:hypothetical protein
MSHVVVDEDEWCELACELSDIRLDAGKVNSFMVNHVNKKWAVSSACFGLFTEFALIRVSVQRNGAPVWLGRAADCEKNVVQWLADKGFKTPAVDSYVRHCSEFAMIGV